MHRFPNRRDAELRGIGDIRNTIQRIIAIRRIEHISAADARETLRHIAEPPFAVISKRLITHTRQCGLQALIDKGCFQACFIRAAGNFIPIVYFGGGSDCA